MAVPPDGSSGRSTDRCLNCATALTGPFCAQCGQEARPPVLTLREFVRDASHQLLDWDGKIPSTLRTLFTEPGRLTLDALAGRRARWLTPLRVYLICSIAFFATKPVIEGLTGRHPRESIRLDIATPAQPGTPLPPEVREAIRSGPPAQIFGADRLERLVTSGIDPSRELNAALQKAMLVLLPVLALLTRVVWRRQLPHYAAHLIAALHVQAAVFGAMTVYWIVACVIPSDIVEQIANLLALVFTIGYGFTAYHRLFNDSWPRTIVKGVLVLIPYALCFFITGLAILGLVIWRM